MTLSVVLLSLVGNGDSGAAQGRVTLIYSANLEGELEPCGCAVESDLGGIRRQAQKLLELRREAPDLILISAGGLLASKMPMDRIKSEFILSGLATMGYDAIGVQLRDLAFGAELLHAAGLPWVSSNARSDSFAHDRRVRRGTVEIVFFSWFDPRGTAMLPQPPADDPQRLAQAIAAAKRSGALTVLLTSLPLAEAQKLLPWTHVDVVVLAAKNEMFSAPQRVDRTLVLVPGSRGMRLGRIELTLGNGNRIADYRQEVIALRADVPDAAHLDGWYQAYNAKLKQDYLKRVELRKRLDSGVSDYLGVDVCKACHAAEYEQWAESKHSRAWETLQAVNKTFDPNCIGCHTVGYDQPGGYIDPSLTYHLVGVQCENCHGAARQHVSSGGAEAVSHKAWPASQMCAQCHVGSHSPSFKLDTYWPRIAHGKRVPATTTAHDAK